MIDNSALKVSATCFSRLYVSMPLWCVTQSFCFFCLCHYNNLLLQPIILITQFLSLSFHLLQLVLKRPFRHSFLVIFAIPLAFLCYTFTNIFLCTFLFSIYCFFINLFESSLANLWIAARSMFDVNIYFSAYSKMAQKGIERRAKELKEHKEQCQLAIVNY